MGNINVYDPSTGKVRVEVADHRLHVGVKGLNKPVDFFRAAALGALCQDAGDAAHQPYSCNHVLPRPKIV